MKVLILNGSPREGGNTSIALEEMRKTFIAEGVEVEIIQVGNKDIRGCIACNQCAKTGKCVFNDIVNKINQKFKEANGLVVASPVYYGNANGTLLSLLERLFYMKSFDRSWKVGASVVVARRGGLSATFDSLNKFFTNSNMPVATSQYWNSVHGKEIGEAYKDLEGLQTMRILAKNMTFLMKCIELGKKEFGLPESEVKTPTNFIR